MAKKGARLQGFVVFYWQSHFLPNHRGMGAKKNMNFATWKPNKRSIFSILLVIVGNPRLPV
jgi:hypothetical protein